MRAKFFLLGIAIAAGATWFGNKWLEGDISIPGQFGKATVTPSQPVTVYKWRDDQGQWHFSNTPPADHAYETQSVQAVNILPAVEAPEAKAPPPAGDTGGIHPLTPITNPGKVKQLVDDARQIEQRLQDRTEQMDNQLK